MYDLKKRNDERGLWRCAARFWDNSELEYCLGRGIGEGGLGEYEIQDDTECGLWMTAGLRGGQGTGGNGGDSGCDSDGVGCGDRKRGPESRFESEFAIGGLTAVMRYDPEYTDDKKNDDWVELAGESMARGGMYTGTNSLRRGTSTGEDDRRDGIGPTGYILGSGSLGTGEYGIEGEWGTGEYNLGGGTGTGEYAPGGRVGTGESGLGDWMDTGEDDLGGWMGTGEYGLGD